jgi:MoxR-like ATPase
MTSALRDLGKREYSDTIVLVVQHSTIALPLQLAAADSDSMPERLREATTCGLPFIVMPLKLPFTTDPSKHGEIAVILPADGALALPESLVLIQATASGGSGSPNLAGGENQTVRDFALKAVLREFPQDSVLLWYQQGAYKRHPHVVCRHPLGELLSQNDEAVCVSDNHTKWLALQLPEGVSADYFHDRFAAPTFREYATGGAPHGFEWLPTKLENLILREDTRAVLNKALTDPALLTSTTPTARVAPSRLTFVTRTLSDQKSVILEGVPGTGKSHSIELLREAVYGERITTIVMHPSTGYEDLIEGVRPTNGVLGRAFNLSPHPEAQEFWQCYGPKARKAEAAPQGLFSVRGGHFLIACAKACAIPTERHLVVLDELNRCNVPRAFGELLLLIEASKRRTWDGEKWVGDHGAVLPYSGLTFFVPDNLHVLGTINTTDRSVAPLDQALRRRFAFHRLEPMKPHLLTHALGVAAKEPVMAEAIAAWNALNGELENRLGPDMMLGHSYFFDAARAMARGTTATSAVRDMWRLAILPQLIDILHTANRADLAEHAELAPHLRSIGLKLEPKGEGLHALLRVCASDAEAKA